MLYLQKIWIIFFYLFLLILQQRNKKNTLTDVFVTNAIRKHHFQQIFEKVMEYIVQASHPEREHCIVTRG